MVVNVRSKASCGAHRVFLTTTCSTPRTPRIPFAIYSHDRHTVHHSGCFFGIGSWLGWSIYLRLSSSTRATIAIPLPTWNTQLPNAVDAASPASTRLSWLLTQDNFRATAGIKGRVAFAVMNVRLGLAALAVSAVHLSSFLFT
jgi:hypothetical protein